MILTKTERRSASWIAALFALIVVFQRVAVPGLPNMSVLLLVAFLWAGFGLFEGVLEVDSTRLSWFLAAGSLTGFLVLMQSRLVAGAQISVSAWGLVLLVWLPFVIRLVSRSPAAYIDALRKIANICTVLGIASLLMLAVQFVGISYQDWFGSLLPHAVQLNGFNTSYPITFGSSIYKSNAFVGLEPSMASLQLGIGILAAIIAQARWWKLLILAAGIVSTVAGSGIIVVVIGLLVILAGPDSRRRASRYLTLITAVSVAAWFTPPGQLVFGRVGEYQSDNSSTAARGIVPYEVLLPEWLRNLGGMLAGYGPGSSQRTASVLTTLDAVQIPTPLKVMYEYGLIGGIALGGFLLLCYWGAPSLALAAALLVSTAFVQSGLASPVIGLPVLALVTAWSPRTTRRPLEWNPDELIPITGRARPLREVGSAW